MLRLLLAPLQRLSAVIRRLLLHPLPVQQLRAGTAWQWRRQLQQHLWLLPMWLHVSGYRLAHAQQHSGHLYCLLTQLLQLYCLLLC